MASPPWWFKAMESITIPAVTLNLIAMGSIAVIAFGTPSSAARRALSMEKEKERAKEKAEAEAEKLRKLGEVRSMSSEPRHHHHVTAVGPTSTKVATDATDATGSSSAMPVNAVAAAAAKTTTTTTTTTTTAASTGVVSVPKIVLLLPGPAGASAGPSAAQPVQPLPPVSVPKVVLMLPSPRQTPP
jgi:hypothetical protein